MAAAGGVVSIYWDFADAKTNFDQAKARGDRTTILGIAYSLRATATGLLVLGQGGIAFSQASMYFQWLAMRRQGTAAGFNLLRLALLSRQVAGNRAAMLLLSRMGWIGGAIAITSTVALLVIDDNALEKWCDKSCFRLTSTAKGYISDEEELTEFFAAAQEVL